MIDKVVHIVTATAAVLVVAVVAGRRMRSKPVGKHVGLGLLMLSIGWYFMPFGGIELYAWTARFFGWSDSWNAVFHYVWTVPLIVFGYWFVYGRD